MKIYRYAKKQFIKLNQKELTLLTCLLMEKTKECSWGYMCSPIDGLPLDLSKLHFNKCIGCGWLQVLIHHTSNPHGAKWGFNTYLKESK